MEGIKSLTGIYYLGIGCGLWNKVEVIEWCDKLIEVSDNPPIELLEVSMMSKSKINDLERKLFELCRVDNEEHYVKLLLSIILEKLHQEQLSLERAIRITSRLLVLTGLAWESEFYYLYSFDDSYDLAIDGIQFQLTEVQRDFIKELWVYKEYISEFKEMYYKVIKQEWIK